MEDRIKGIIIKQTDYRENDMIVTTLLDNGKKISLICKGVKKITSRNAMGVMPFLTSEFIFNFDENKTIFNLKNCKIIKNRKNISKDLIDMSYASLMCQIVDTFIIDDEDLSLNIYKLLDFCLDELNDKDNSLNVMCFFISMFLENVGLKPNVDGCVFDDNKKIVGISIIDGGFICSNCINKTSTYKDIDESHLRNFRILNKVNYSNYDEFIKLNVFDKKDLFILLDFYMHHTGLKLKTYDFLKSII